MIRVEKNFIEVLGEFKIGERCILVLPDGKIVHTSKVENYSINQNGCKIITKNTIYILMNWTQKEMTENEDY